MVCRSTSLLCALMMLAGGAYAQTLPKIDAEIRATRLSVALDALEAKLGIQLSVSTALADEVIVLRFRQADGGQALTKIAETVGGEWTKSPTEWRLERSAEMTKTLAASEIEQLSAAIKKDLEVPFGRFPWATSEGEAPQADMPQPTPGSDDEEISEEDRARAQQLAKFSQDLRKANTTFATELAKPLDTKAMAAMAVGDRWVFSTHPRAGQRGLPAAANQIFQTFVSEARKRLNGLPKGSEENPVGIPDEWQILPTRALMIVRRTTPSKWEIFVRMYGPENQLVAQEGKDLELLDQATMARMDPTRGTNIKPKFALKKPDVLVPIREEFKGFANVINSMMQGAPPPMVNLGPMRDIFSKPLEIDPLSGAASEVLQMIATDQDTQLVAMLPDEAIMLDFAGFMAPEIRLGTAVAMIESIDLTEMQSADGWITMKPKFPLVASQSRLNRGALQKIIDLERKNGTVTMLEVAEFALSYPERSEMMLQIYSLLLLRTIMQDSVMGFGTGNMDAYRLLGTLTAEQRRRILAGEAIPYGQLLPPQRKQFEVMLHDIASLETDSQIGMFQLPAMFANSRSSSTPMPFGDYTDVASTMGGTASLSAKINRETVVSGISEGIMEMMMGNRAMTADEVAMNQMMLESPESASFAAFLPKLDRVRLGERQTIVFKLNVRDNFGAMGQISGTTFSSGPQGIPFKDLPKAFLDAVNAARERMQPSTNAPEEGTKPFQEPPPGQTP